MNAIRSQNSKLQIFIVHTNHLHHQTNMQLFSILEKQIENDVKRQQEKREQNFKGQLKVLLNLVLVAFLKAWPIEPLPPKAITLA